MKTIRFNVVGRMASLLDSKYADQVAEAFSFSVPSARYTPAHKVWLQQKALGIPEEERSGWNGMHSMMKDGEIAVGLLLGAKDDLSKAGFTVKIKDWKDKPKVRKEGGFSEDNVKYSYQNDAVHAMLDSISSGGGLVLSATGSGKTKVASQFFSWLKCDCLFIVDQVDLLYQSQKEIQEWLSKEGYDNKVGVVGNGKFDPQRITIATIQTLHKQKNKASFKKWVKNIEVVLIDEIHVQMARRNFNVLDKIKPQAVIGLTATMQLKRKPVRYKCFSICGPKVFDFPMSKGVEAGVLSQGVVVQLPVSKNPAENPNIRFKEQGRWITKPKYDPYMHEVVNNKYLHAMTCQLAIACLAQDLCVVILVDRIKHLKKLENRLEEFDPKVFYGAVAISDRKKQLKKFDAGKENLIIANRVFTKGINLKRIDVVIDAAQRSSRNDCIQKFGRAVRLHTEKAGVLYFDLYTEGKLEKPAKQRKGAFKQAKIPFIALKEKLSWSAKEIIAEADKLLTAALKKNKQNSEKLK